MRAPRPFRAAFAALVLAFAAAPALAGDADATACRFVPGQGPSCPVEGGWRVTLPDGSSVLTHGPDPVLPLGAALDALHAASALPPAAPSCVREGEAGPRGVLVYARPAERLDRSAAFAPVMVASFLRANAVLAAEAASLGHAAAYRVLCDASGVPIVRAAVLPTPNARAGFWTIVGDLAAQGFARSDEKYWIFYDDAVACGCSGQGTIWYDDRPVASNWNNRGPSWGIAYGSSTAATSMWFTLMHENGHNVGAVQLSAPNTSGGWHCNDGLDVMCYADGGPRSDYSSSRCRGTSAFDCGHDDYFHPAPPPGSYLATRWNVANSAWLDVRPLA